MQKTDKIHTTDRLNTIILLVKITCNNKHYLTKIYCICKTKTVKNTLGC